MELHSMLTSEPGLHLGPAKIPQSEDDPRVTLESNFYYSQEDALFAWCKKHAVGWTTARPSFIGGAVPDAAVSALLFGRTVAPLGIDSEASRRSSIQVLL